MNEETGRLGFPLLASGQAQKEITHNEALALADMLVQPVVQVVAPANVPASPVPGQCWIVGGGATGAWAGHDGAIACWTAGGWRFAPPFDGMVAWSLADALPVKRAASAWEVGQIDAAAVRIHSQQVLGARQPAIADASGGTTIDAEIRVVVAAILAALRAHGLITA
jgi:hypothetical protein